MPATTVELYNVKSANAPQFTYHLTLKAPSSTPQSSAMLSGPSRELPMPTVSRIISLNQAHATLQHCWTKLANSWRGQAHSPSNSPAPSSPIQSGERRHYQQWLEKWEQAFTAYLAHAVAGMKSEEVTRCRILKANHLACTVLASEAGPDQSSFDVFEAEFQAIIELAHAVIRSRVQASASANSDPAAESSIGSNTMLDVREPLQVVVARCSRSSVRNQAIDILAHLAAQ